MFITKNEIEAQKAICIFWDENKGVPQQWRNKLIEEFTDEWGGKVSLTKPFIRHPSTRKKNFKNDFSILDILTDFILDTPQVEERKKEYPIYNEEKRFRDESSRKGLELSVIFDEDKSDKNDFSYVPPYSIEEHSFNARDPIEELFFSESNAETVLELSELIEEVKRNEDEYIKKYANPFAEWNQYSDKKRTEDNVRKAIRRLDVSRVTECRVCGGAFYAHDKRSEICDIQPYPHNKKRSCCQVINNRNNAKNDDLEQKNSIYK